MYSHELGEEENEEDDEEKEEEDEEGEEDNKGCSKHTNNFNSPVKSLHRILTATYPSASRNSKHT